MTDFKNIKAFTFDIDGVMTDGGILADLEGQLYRTFDAKDGFAVRMACLNGFPVGVITGGRSQSIRARFSSNGINPEDIYLGSRNKIEDFEDFCRRHNLKPEEVMYFGDDIPDIEVIRAAGIGVCPNDAVEEVKEAADIISDRPGGKACVREYMEKAMKAQGRWVFDAIAYKKNSKGFLNMDTHGKRIILASNSPRRRELLAGLDIKFTVDTGTSFVEQYSPDTPHVKVPELMSEGKSSGFHRKLEPDEILVTSDTMVLCGTEILGKPHDRADAVRMLKLLSGREHQVITAVTIRDCHRTKTFSVTSDVYFKNLSDSEIDYYIDNFKPFDKAGAYGIQEWIGYVGISRLDGSFYNVMGFPTQRFYEELQDFLNGR